MTLAKVTQARKRYLKAGQTLEQARVDLREAIGKARATHTLQEIGDALGMTRQGVYDLLNRKG